VDGGNAGAVETCDGIDNDGNGIADDVDVDRDGVCDCLRLATLGFPGVWGSGNVFKDWYAGKSKNGAISLGVQTLTAAALAPFHVIVVQDVRVGSSDSSGPGNGIGRAYSSDEVQALKDWVHRGGGLMTLMGYVNDAVEQGNVAKLLAPFGLSYGSAVVLGGSAPPKPSVTHWAAHPISEEVQKVGIHFGYPVSGGTLLAWEPTQGQWDVGRVTEFGAGHVFAWSDEWISYSSSWPADHQTQRFWVNALKWLTVAGYCQVRAGP
jgi:hypothetical protein